MLFTLIGVCLQHASVFRMLLVLLAPQIKINMLLENYLQSAEVKFLLCKMGKKIHRMGRLHEL